MGGRGATASGWKGGGGGASPLSTEDLISHREGHRTEVDQTLSVLRDINKQYGKTVDTEIGKFPPGATVMGYYDLDSGNVGLSNSYFDSDKLDKTYDGCVKNRFHPSRGNKSGTEAVVAHEMGHALTGVVAEKMGVKFDSAANRIVQDAKKDAGFRGRASDWAAKISGYANTDPSEAIAEAFSDVYCNGRNANKVSIAICNRLDIYLGGRK